ncbi:MULTISPECIES: WD40 repeat domain-containing protein [unclassified Coleofasciculus]|uniref:WD40 repeat domain-containing protein n=1 Tax=unclassified Coleofasciculus TaxID=2692782 RepID=UPI0018816324|nr:MULTISPECIES: WD40 repeat domain-containing protein [unclassified Coleofasciculus]MBE9124671.1 WD40 repeat domain-containing protein [Coleofasciculus sp. LEGE 07081]MBE9146998.1 WD40 repeat domain-containing protein [Coleofasciculus sp. LEGE 07092]
MQQITWIRKLPLIPKIAKLFRKIRGQLHQLSKSESGRLLQERLLIFTLVTVLGVAGWVQYNYVSLTSKKVVVPITPNTVSDIQENLDIEVMHHSGEVISVAYSNYSDIFASASVNGIIKLWELNDSKKTYAHKQTLNIGDKQVKAMAFGSYEGDTSYDGYTIAVGREDGTIELWNISSEGEAHSMTRPLTSQTKEVTSIAFHPTTKILASASKDKTIKLWKIEDGKEIKTLKNDEGEISSVAFNPRGNILAIGTGSTNNGKIKLWSLNPEKPADLKDSPDQTLEHGSPVKCIAFNPVGFSSNLLKYILGQDQLASGGTDGNIKLWTIENNLKKMNTDLMRSLAPHDQILSLAFSGDGKILASGGADGTIKLWSISNGKELRILKSHPYAVNSLAFNSLESDTPESDTLATGSWDETIKLWQVTDKLRIGWESPPLIGF